MEKVLMTGSGELFLSVVNDLKMNSTFESITIIPFDQFLNLHKAMKEDDFFEELCHWQNFNRFYLFPNDRYEGMVYTSFISEWFLGNLFIVTEERGCQFLYKKN